MRGQLTVCRAGVWQTVIGAGGSGPALVPGRRASMLRPSSPPPGELPPGGTGPHPGRGAHLPAPGVSVSSVRGFAWGRPPV